MRAPTRARRGRGAQQRPLVVLTTLLALGGCGDDHAELAPALAQAEVAPEQVIARVNGVPIVAADLRHQMREGADRRVALDALVKLELLAQQARRRGFASHPSVRHEQRQAMANLFLRRTFADKYTKQSIPRSFLERAYARNRRRFVHPELVTVSHVLTAPIDRKRPPEQQRASRRLAHKAHAIAASGKLSVEEFTQIRELLTKEAKQAQVRVIVESLTTPLRGSVVDAFADAAFALRRPGDISPVVQTQFGYHVIYLEKRTAARDDSLDAVIDEIRERVFDDARLMSLDQLLKGLEQQYGVEIFPDALARADRAQ